LAIVLSILAQKQTDNGNCELYKTNFV